MNEQCEHRWLLPNSIAEAKAASRITGRCLACGHTELQPARVWLRRLVEQIKKRQAEKALAARAS